MLQPAGSLNHLTWPLSQGFSPVPARRRPKPLVSYQTYRQLSGWDFRPLAIRAVGAHTTFRLMSVNSFVFIYIPALLSSLSQQPFVFIDIPASFVQFSRSPFCFPPNRMRGQIDKKVALGCGTASRGHFCISGLLGELPEASFLGGKAAASCRTPKRFAPAKFPATH